MDGDPKVHGTTGRCAMAPEFRDFGDDEQARISDRFGMRPREMNFGEAIENLKHGLKVTRRGWNGKGMWLALQVPDRGSKMSLPYIYMRTAQGDLVPWLASQTDMLAEDWRIAS